MQRRTHTAFSRWLEESGLTAAVLAQRLGVTRGAVYQWAQGRSAPTVAHLVALDRLSEGKVTPSMFLNENEEVAHADDPA